MCQTRTSSLHVLLIMTMKCIQTYNARVKRSVREQVRMASAIIFSFVFVPLIDLLVKFVFGFTLLGIVKKDFSLIRFNS